VVLQCSICFWISFQYKDITTYMYMLWIGCIIHSLVCHPVAMSA
jgi:hypothetical protein